MPPGALPVCCVTSPCAVASARRKGPSLAPLFRHRSRKMAARPPPLSRPDVRHGGQRGLAMLLPHRGLPVGSGGEHGQPAASRGGLPAAGLHLQAPPSHSRARPPAPAGFPERAGRLRSRSGQRPWSRTALRAPSGGPGPHSQPRTVPPWEQPYFPIPPHLMCSCSSSSRHSCSPSLQRWRNEHNPGLRAPVHSPQGRWGGHSRLAGSPRPQHRGSCSPRRSHRSHGQAGLICELLLATALQPPADI